ncbi:rhombosortase [Alkanindiges illinoisensis]|uniref:Rhombosortase n=1 Tax=Alkanindiges illinoisensis TaxID=197183 RepID=A0A4Y7XEZ1_9GAMM|nr:rhombosortase [Alkanindiges illinoisensis]TEU29256.1 rhombosortase [Alkanindiges illinoisensis]
MWPKQLPSLLPIILGIGLVCGLLQLDMNTFIYQRDVMTGEPWRWWTAHWVHVGWRHYALNMLAFLSLPFIFPQLQRQTLLLGLLVLPPLLSAGLYELLPAVQAYAGLSGILHGIFVVAAIESLFIQRERKFAILVLVCIALKIGVEKWMGYSETAQFIQAPVLIESHQIGVLTGIIFILLKTVICYLKHKNSLTKL